MKKRNKIFAATAASALLLSGCSAEDYVEKIGDFVEDIFVDDNDDGLIDESTLGIPAVEEPLTGDVPWVEPEIDSVPKELYPDELIPPELEMTDPDDSFIRVDPAPESGVTDI